MTDAPRVVGYVRVSSPEQAEKFGLAAQEAAIRRYCAEQGYPEPVVRIEPGLSAFSDELADRPAFAALMEDVAAGRFDLVVVDQIDRFARSNLVAVQQLRHLYAHRCALVSLKERWDFSTASGRFQFQLMASLAEFDSRLKSERTKAAIAQKRLQGGYHGGWPWGATKDGRGALVVDPARADWLRRILTLCAERGALVVAAHLTANNVPTAKGNAVWRPSAVHSFIKKGAWLLDQPEPWPTLYRAARDRPRLPRTTSARGVNLLSGLLRCACGGVVVYSSSRSKATGERYLECRNYSKERPNGHNCPYYGKYPAPHYEGIVERAFLALPALEEEPEDATVAESRVRLAERRAVAETIFFDNADRAAYRARLAALAAEEAALPVPLPLGAALATELPSIQALWPGLTTAERNGVLRRYIARVEVERQECRIAWVGAVAAMLAAQERREAESAG